MKNESVDGQAKFKLAVPAREAPLGDVGKIRTNDFIFLGQRLYHFRPDPKKLDADFLLYALMAPDLQCQIRALGSGSTVEHMRLGDIPSLVIDIPTLPLQRRIAGILSAYDELIENNQRRIQILEEMARSLYREWFVHFRFPGHDKVKMVSSPVGPIPQGWEGDNIWKPLQYRFRRNPEPHKAGLLREWDNVPSPQYGRVIFRPRTSSGSPSGLWASS